MSHARHVHTYMNTTPLSHTQPSIASTPYVHHSHTPSNYSAIYKLHNTHTLCIYNYINLHHNHTYLPSQSPRPQLPPSITAFTSTLTKFTTAPVFHHHTQMHNQHTHFSSPFPLPSPFPQSPHPHSITHYPQSQPPTHTQRLIRLISKTNSVHNRRG